MVRKDMWNRRTSQNLVLVPLTASSDEADGKPESKFDPTDVVGVPFVPSTPPAPELHFYEHRAPPQHHARGAHHHGQHHYPEFVPAGTYDYGHGGWPGVPVGPVGYQQYPLAGPAFYVHSYGPPPQPPPGPQYVPHYPPRYGQPQARYGQPRADPRCSRRPDQQQLLAPSWDPYVWRGRPMGRPMDRPRSRSRSPIRGEAPPGRAAPLRRTPSPPQLQRPGRNENEEGQRRRQQQEGSNERRRDNTPSLTRPWSMEPGVVAHKNLSANAIARLRTCDEEPVAKRSKCASRRSEAVPDLTAPSTPCKSSASNIAVTPPIQQQPQIICRANQSIGTNSAPTQSQGHACNSPTINPQRLSLEQCNKNSDKVVKSDGSQSFSCQNKYKEPLKKKNENVDQLPSEVQPAFDNNTSAPKNQSSTVEPCDGKKLSSEEKRKSQRKPSEESQSISKSSARSHNKKDEAACKPKKSKEDGPNDATVSDAVSRSRHKSSSRHNRKEKESEEKKKRNRSKEKVESRDEEKQKRKDKDRAERKKYEEGKKHSSSQKKDGSSRKSNSVTKSSVESTKKLASGKQDKNLPLHGAKTAPQEKLSTKSSSDLALKSKSSESSKAKTGGIEESALFPPTFNKAFRIPKKVATLPNPLLSSASSSKSLKITPTTWLQKNRVSKPAAFAPKGATLNVEKLILLRGSNNEGNKGEWRVDRKKSTENNDTAGNSQGVKSLSALQSLKDSYSNQEESKEKRKENTKPKDKGSEQPISEVGTHSVSKDERRKSKASVEKDNKRKKRSLSRNSNNSRKSRNRRYSDNSDDWTPSGRPERRGRSRTPVNPENSGVASRTRSRTRSPSTRQTKSYTAAYSDSDDSENDHELFSSWDNQQIGNWLSEADKTTTSNSSAPVTQNPETLTKSLKNCSLVKQRKKALLAKDVYTSLESVSLQASLSQTPNPATPSRLCPESPVVESPPMPSLPVAAQESPVVRNEMPDILPSPENSGHPVSTPASPLASSSARPSVISANKTTPSLISSACQPPPIHTRPRLAISALQPPPVNARPPLARSASQPPDSSASDEIFVLDSEEHLSHQAELIDLEEELPFNINASFAELWRGIKAEQRNKFETLECCLANAIDEINCFTSRYRDVEKKPSKDWRLREIAVLRENFKNTFNRSWVTICDGIERLLFDYTEKEIFIVLTKKIGANIDYLSDPLGVYQDMKYLHELLNSKTLLELPRNCGTCVTVAAKLFTLHQKSKIYNLPSVNPPLSVEGITPLRTVADSTVQTAETPTSSGVLEPEKNPTESTSFVEFEDDSELRSSKEASSEEEEEEEEDDNFLKCLICPEKAEIQCSQCRCAVYCDVSCQTRHWSNGHEKECSENLSSNPSSS